MFDKFDSKYSNFLTILLIAVIVGIVGLLGFFGVDLFKKFHTEYEAGKFAQQFEDDVKDDDKNIHNNEENNNDENPLENIESVQSSAGTKTYKYKGFDVSGTIEIPKTNIKYPILSKVSKKGLETSVAIQYGVGLNQIGNTVIVGHNYRNGLFFSNNKKLSNGDNIYITDNSGIKVRYVIYNKYETTPEDTDYMLRDTAGKKEISLSTCTDDSSKRLIIWAKEEQNQ